MTKPLKLLLLVTALVFCGAVGATQTLAAEPCPNEQLRAENSSVNLPDCRAYELVSPDSNHTYIGVEQGGVVTADGNTMLYSTGDAPEHASSGEQLANKVLANRDPATGWSGASFSPPLVGPVTSFQSFGTLAVSSDLSTTVVFSTQPLDASPREAGYKVYRGSPGAPYRALTTVPSTAQPGQVVGNADFTHVYFVPFASQLSSDPVAGNGTYSWTAQEGLRLVGILPGGTPAPEGARLVGTIIGPISADATRALFVSAGRLYLRVDDERTIEIGATVNIDPSQTDPTISDRAGITSDGSTVLFTSREALTPQSNTGPSHAGRDLYSYDVASGQLTDLTVDTDPADSALGADVGFVAGASPDGSCIYFTAKGSLAPGATAGHTSLYVWHVGHIAFVSSADGLPDLSPFDVTPNGQHIAFASTDSLTGYDNLDPITGQPHVEIFKANFGAGIECVSCRVNGTRPTGDSFLAQGTGLVSNDGTRVFFGSTDAVVPEASNGLRQVFEYENGGVSAISPLNSTSNADLFVASATGDDVFFKTYEPLVPNPNSGPGSVIDARVAGGFPNPGRPQCSGDACQGPISQAPSAGTPTTSAFSGAGNLAAAVLPPAVKTQPKPLTRAQKLAKALKACKSKHRKKKRVSCEKQARRSYGRRR